MKESRRVAFAANRYYFGWRMPLLVVVALGILHPGASPASTIRHDVPDRRYTNLAGQSQFASVGKLMIGGTTCSGTLITQHHVLTAGHCISGKSASNVSFTLGAAINALSLQDVYTGSTLDGTDIGIVNLAQPITSVTPAARFTGTNEVGMTGASVGFGHTGNGNTGDTQVSATKRAFQNDIDGTLATIARSGDTVMSSDILLADFDHPDATSDSSMGANTPLALEGQAALGDSGSGLFVQVGSTWLLAGVLSFRDAPNYYNASNPDTIFDSDYGDVTGWTKVSSYSSWINSLIATLGDVDLDGDIDADDIDRLYAEFDNPTAWNPADLDFDGDADQDDTTKLVQDILNTNYGDANLDGSSGPSGLQRLVGQRRWWLG